MSEITTTGLDLAKNILQLHGTVDLKAIMGAPPGIGATTASFISYSEALCGSRHPEKFGTGVAEGIGRRNPRTNPLPAAR